MATKYFKLTGPCKWAKLSKPDQKYNVYSINLYLDERGLKTLKESGVQLTVKQDDQGSYVVFRRPVAKLIRGDLVKFDPPKVSIQTPDGYPEYTGLVGNGSVVTCDIAVYDTIKGKGHTLQSVTVRELVEYVSKQSD